MKEEWWERPTCFLCDRWWLLLVFLAMGLTAYFTNGYWMPALGVAATPSAGTSTIQTTLSLSQGASAFTSPQGEYSLEYPSDWETETLDEQTQQWTPPEGAVVSVHSEPIQPGDTLESFAEDVVSRLPYDVLNQTQVEVGGEHAIRQEVASPGGNDVMAVGYLVLHDGKKYQIALAELNGLPPDEKTRIIQEFDQVVSIFLFQQ